MTRNPFFAGAAIGAVLSWAMAGAGTAAAADFEETATFASGELTVTNLIGKVDIEGTEGTAFEVVVRVHGKDATRENVRIEKKQGSRAQLDVVFPVRRQAKFVYPPMGSGSRTSVSVPRRGRDGEGPLEAVLRALDAREIQVSGKGSGLEMWADVSIRVPRGGELRVDGCVGAISASKVAAPIDLRLASGPVSATAVDGDVRIDTGSGAVTVEGAKGGKLLVDTGSGSVHVSGADCGTVNVDTGSGRIEAKGIAADDLRMDTGSGSVSLECDRIGNGSYVIDTGSGSIDLILPENASAEIVADTGSGNIDIDVGRVDVIERDDSSIRFRIGTGEADIRIDTGSGSIDISS